MTDLKDIEKYSLSDADIQQLLTPNKTKIIIYPDLRKYSDINQCFDRLGRCVLLYPLASEFSGHWVGIIKHDDGVIEYFDAYGNKPDTEKKWITPEQVEKLGMTENYLSNLLQKAYEDGYKIIYNPHKLQSDKRNVNDCGRHVVCRLLFKDLSLENYIKYIKDRKMTPDEFVSKITFQFLGK